MKREKPSSQAGETPAGLEKRRKYAEGGATLGLLLVLGAMIAPFAGSLTGTTMMWAKWVYAAGALIYTSARVVDVNAPGDSLSLRRLRRL